MLAGALLSLMLLAGCPQHTSIGNLTARSGYYMGKEVGVAGTVVSSFGLLGQGAFEIDDGTGRIWVLSNGYGVPNKGARVGVAGRFTSGVSFGGRSFAAAIEQTHRPHY
jgi:hypothetical protein